MHVCTYVYNVFLLKTQCSSKQAFATEAANKQMSDDRVGKDSYCSLKATPAPLPLHRHNARLMGLENKCSEAFPLDGSLKTQEDLRHLISAPIRADLIGDKSLGQPPQAWWEQTNISNKPVLAHTQT